MKSEKIKITAVVPIFNPDLLFYQSINSYYNFVDKIIIWKNSSLSDELFELLKTNFGFEKIILLGDGHNCGIGKALNNLCKYAFNNLNSDFVLTMDQDSVFQEKSFELMTIEIQNNFHELFLFSPSHLIGGNQLLNDTSPSWVMTSGNFFSQETYVKVGDFNEFFFIDGVDLEWCDRLKRTGGDICVVNEAILLHRLGDTQSRKFLFFNINVLNHNSFRYYYIYRNYFQLIFSMKSSLKFRSKVFSVVIQISIGILFFEKNKLEKLKMAFLGIFNFIKSN